MTNIRVVYGMDCNNSGRLLSHGRSSVGWFFCGDVGITYNHKNNFLIQFYIFITHGSVKSYVFGTILTRLEKALVLDFYIDFRLCRNKDIGNQDSILASSSEV